MLKNRFLSVFVLAFAAGIAMPFLLGTGMEAVAFLIGLCVFLPAMGISLWVLLWRKKGKNVFLYLAFAGIGFCLGAGWLWARSVPYDAYTAYEGREDVAEGVVTESGSSMESSYLELKLERSHIGLPAGTKIRLYGSSGTIRIGDYVRVACDYGKVSSPSYRSTGVDLTANGSVISHTPDDSVLNAFRNTMLDACQDLYAPYDSVGVAQALTVRERSLLPYETGDGYRNAGVAHLLAISGLHLSILIALLRRILLALRLRKITRECLALGVILLYCFLTGFSPSIVRASVMLGFVLLGELFQDETDSITVLFFALLLLLIANPYALLSVGLQLSFLSCLGILLLEPHVSDLQKKIRGDAKAKHKRLRKLGASLAGSFLISSGAIVFTFPVTTVSFGDVSYLAPVSNLVFIPLFTPVLAVLLLSVLVYPLLPFLGHGLAVFPGLTLRGMDWLFGRLAQADVGTVSIETQWVAIPVLLSVLAIAFMFVLSKRAMPFFLACAAGAMLSVLVLACIPRGSAWLLTVSGSRGYVYLCDGESCVFADIGSWESRPEDLGQYLEAYLVVEADEASLHRLKTVSQATRIQTVYLPMTDSQGHKNDLSSFRQLAQAQGISVHEFRYAVETPLLRYDVREGCIQTDKGIAILLPGCPAPSEAQQYVLLPGFSHHLPSVAGATYYLPSSCTGALPSQGQIQYYTDFITFQDGEVTAS